MFDSSKLDQAMTYLLEYVVTSALMDDFGAAAPGIIERWQSIPAFHRHPGENLDSRTAVFCGWSKRQRAVGFADLLFSLDPAYQTFYPIMVRNGCTNLISPEEYETFEDIEWPNPRW